MTAKGNAGVAAAGVAACVVCCAPAVGAGLAAIGLGTALGVAVFGVVGLSVALLAVPLVVRRKRATRNVTES